MVSSPAELTKEAKAEDLIVYYTKQKLWHLVLELLACGLKNSWEYLRGRAFLPLEDSSRGWDLPWILCSPTYNNSLAKTLNYVQRQLHPTKLSFNIQGTNLNNYRPFSKIP